MALDNGNQNEGTYPAAGGEFQEMNRSAFVVLADLKQQLADTPADGYEAQRLRHQIDQVIGEIVVANSGLVGSYVRRFTTQASKMDREDLYQAGNLGLIKAINSFNPALGSLSHWAFKPIQREVIKTLHRNEHGWLRAADFDRRPAILAAFNEVAEESTFLDATRDEIYCEVAARASVTLAQVTAVLDANAPVSIHGHAASAYDPDANSLEDSLRDTAEDIASEIETKIQFEQALRYGLSVLDPSERYIIIRRLGLDLEPKARLFDIGEALGLSREGVRQRELRALAKLAHPCVLRKIVSRK